MDTQLIIVIIIGVAVAAIILRGIFRFFFTKSKNNYCGTCTSCSLSKDWNEEEEVDPYTAYLKQE